jgi:mono/diheme cytochrome c family protein
MERGSARLPAGFLALALGLIVAAACGRAAADTASRPPERIYATNCGYCHGHNVGPLIRGRGLPSDYVATMVRHGRGPMPAFRQTEISPAELDALARWISASRPDPREHGA